MKKIIYVLILNLVLILNANAKSHNLAQVAELNKLFKDLSKANNAQDGDILEKKIWAVWNKHPSQSNLTEKICMMSTATSRLTSCSAHSRPGDSTICH